MKLENGGLAAARPHRSYGVAAAALLGSALVACTQIPALEAGAALFALAGLAAFAGALVLATRDVSDGTQAKWLAIIAAIVTASFVVGLLVAT
ncbi:hypothetical protein, partial [Demequina salsinemoris]|uniref:hypothetical protein n=1 Tax=Demequina salsinemoris TaxID=577470 RepID=UPI000A5F2F5F